MNGHGNLAEKLTNLNLRDDQRLKNNTERPNEGTLNKVRPQPNGKHQNLSGFNGHHNHIKKAQHTRQQRVPSADEFPVLAGSITPPKFVNGNGHIGLTAAQVLQAPPPMRKDVSKDSSKDSSTRNTTPEPAHGVPSRVCDLLSTLKFLSTLLIIQFRRLRWRSTATGKKRLHRFRNGSYQLLLISILLCPSQQQQLRILRQLLIQSKRSRFPPRINLGFYFLSPHIRHDTSCFCFGSYLDLSLLLLVVLMPVHF